MDGWPIGSASSTVFPFGEATRVGTRGASRMVSTMAGGLLYGSCAKRATGAIHKARANGTGRRIRGNPGRRFDEESGPWGGTAVGRYSHALLEHVVEPTRPRRVQRGRRPPQVEPHVVQGLLE